MKQFINKFNLLLIFTLFASALQAEQISENKAALIARKYLQTNTIKPLRTTGTTVNNAEYYIFNDTDKQGFVIVSGDDELTELVGYSQNGNFDLDGEVPSNVSDWLNNYASYVKAVRSNKVSPVKKVVKANATIVIDSLLTTSWGQGFPYKDLCPYDEKVNKTCPTGCAATAFAQIMKYWEWPDVGVGVHSYKNAYRTETVDFSQSVYDWAYMKDKYTLHLEDDGYFHGDWFKREGEAVAKLMYDCGVAIDMEYGPNASGGSEKLICISGAKHLKYDSEYYERDCMTTQQFRNTIKNAISSKKPVLFVGYGDTSGHAFVADGYDTNDFFHINWGWDSHYNGYFDVNYMNPEGVGTGGDESGFNNQQKIVILSPNKTGNAQYGQFCLSLIQKSHNVGFEGGIEGIQSSIQKGENLNVNTLGIVNLCPGFNCFVGAAVYDMEGNQLTTPSDSLYLQMSYLLYTNYVVPFTLNSELTDLPDGKYQIYPVSKEVREGCNFEWIRFSSPKHIDIEVKGNTINIANAYNTNVLTIEEPFSIKVNGKEKALEMNDEVTISYTINNPTEHTAEGLFYVYIFKADELYPFLNDSITCKIRPHSKQTFSERCPLLSEIGFEKGGKYKFMVYPAFYPTNGINFYITSLHKYDCYFTIGNDASIEENIVKSDVKVYPNPATDRITVDTEDEILDISLYATDGRLMKQVKNTNEMNVNDCPAGYYIISIQTEKGTINKQIIKK